MLEIKNLSFAYNRWRAKAVADASGIVSPGIWLLAGHNGAGKTTLLRILATLVTPQRGEVLLDGEIMARRTPSLLQRVFFLPDDLWVPASSINVLARRDARFYPNFSSELLAQNLEAFSLTGDEPLANASLGQRRKSFIAYALSLGVELLLMDEPANGLDIDSKKIMRAMMARCVGENQTVIVSTHNVDDLQELYDGLMLMHTGHLVLCSTTALIADRVACVHSQLPLPDALYSEQRAGLYNSLVANRSGQPGAIDFSLLYSAVMSGNGQAVLWSLSSPATDSQPSQTV